jgi:deoxyribonuclease V
MENQEKETEESRKEKIIKKYNLDLEQLKREQLKIAKQLEIKDKIDFKLADSFGAVDNTFINNKLLSCFIVCDKDFEIVDRAYAFEKVKFPYIPGFRNYRELPVMIEAFEKLQEKPDLIFVPAQGMIHPRLGLASHFSLATGIPTIGVSNAIVDCEVEGEDIIKQGKKVGKVLSIKPGSKPMYISPGNQISVETAIEQTKTLVKLPHKRPEPLHLAAKYARGVRKELSAGQ